MKAQWLTAQLEESNITSYIILHIEEAQEIAQQNWEKAQIKQQQWYDNQEPVPTRRPGTIIVAR